ncbi:hypothetical protein [Calothrix sp. UHCC 0171]|uniref:hypothetical protein n=1 Tax=Calothrix sp. UHCC 0171 TaxID=3110245 RepID=UPI002B1EADEB|nr:hypothetical protein [Calothrix sp. UHCC 0171]MEA5574646.1 hypothetical protein [Calothrix sp. UHCC 0171]
MSKFKSILTAAKENSTEVEPEAVTPEVVLQVPVPEPTVEIKPEPESSKPAKQKSSKQKPSEKPIQAKPTETTEPKKMGRPKGKRSDPDYEQVTAYIKSGTYTNVKIELLKEGQKREFSELIQELLDDWLDSRS